MNNAAVPHGDLADVHMNGTMVLDGREGQAPPAKRTRLGFEFDQSAVNVFDEQQVRQELIGQLSPGQLPPDKVFRDDGDPTYNAQTDSVEVYGDEYMKQFRVRERLLRANPDYQFLMAVRGCLHTMDVTDLMNRDDLVAQLGSVRSALRRALTAQIDSSRSQRDSTTARNELQRMVTEAQRQLVLHDTLRSTVSSDIVRIVRQLELPMDICKSQRDEQTGAVSDRVLGMDLFNKSNAELASELQMYVQMKELLDTGSNYRQSDAVPLTSRSIFLKFADLMNAKFNQFPSVSNYHPLFAKYALYVSTMVFLVEDASSYARFYQLMSGVLPAGAVGTSKVVDNVRKLLLLLGNARINMKSDDEEQLRRWCRLLYKPECTTKQTIDHLNLMIDEHESSLPPLPFNRRTVELCEDDRDDEFVRAQEPLSDTSEIKLRDSISYVQTIVQLLEPLYIAAARAIWLSRQRSQQSTSIGNVAQLLVEQDVSSVRKTRIAQNDTDQTPLFVSFLYAVNFYTNTLKCTEDGVSLAMDHTTAIAEPTRAPLLGALQDVLLTSRTFQDLLNGTARATLATSMSLVYDSLLRARQMARQGSSDAAAQWLTLLPVPLPSQQPSGAARAPARATAAASAVDADDTAAQTTAAAQQQAAAVPVQSRRQLRGAEVNEIVERARNVFGAEKEKKTVCELLWRIMRVLFAVAPQSFTDEAADFTRTYCQQQPQKDDLCAYDDKFTNARKPWSDVMQEIHVSLSDRDRELRERLRVADDRVRDQVRTVDSTKAVAKQTIEAMLAAPYVPQTDSLNDPLFTGTIRLSDELRMAIELARIDVEQHAPALRRYSGEQLQRDKRVMFVYARLVAQHYQQAAVDNGVRFTLSRTHDDMRVRRASLIRLLQRLGEQHPVPT